MTAVFPTSLPGPDFQTILQLSGQNTKLYQSGGVAASAELQDEFIVITAMHTLN